MTQVSTLAAGSIDNTLCEFFRTYRRVLNDEMDARGRGKYHHNGAVTKFVIVYKARDGYAAIHVPAPPPEVKTPPYDTWLIDHSDLTLDELCAELSAGFIRIIRPDTGTRVSSLKFELPARKPINAVDGEYGMWFGPEIRAAIFNRSAASMPGMAISPIVRMTDGVVQEVLPGRQKIWSPTIHLAGSQPQRMYHWSHLDLWWMPERLDLSENAAIESAKIDALSLELLLHVNSDLSPEVAERGTAKSASDVLLGMCVELEALLSSPDSSEETLHQWLNQECHHLFLDPHALRVWSKLRFGATVSDFVVRRSDGTYTLIEIESAARRIFKPSDSEPTAEFNHACQQVRDWMRYVHDNVSTVRHELGLIDIYQPRGVVIIGRSADIGTPLARQRLSHIRGSGDIAVLTYDDMVDATRQLAGLMQKVMVAS